MQASQALDYNTAVAAVLEIYEQLGDLVVPITRPPARGWNAPQQLGDVHQRIEFALGKLATLAPDRLTPSNRRRLDGVDSAR